MEDFYEVRLNHPEEAISPVTYKGVSFQRCLQRYNEEYCSDVNSKQVIEHFYNIFAAPMKASGFKFKYPLQPVLFPEIVKEIPFLGSTFKLVILYRDNHLKQAISRKNLERVRPLLNSHANLGKKNENAKGLLRQPFTLEIDEVIAYARQLQKQQVEFEEMASQFLASTGGSSIKIRYEDLLAREQETLVELFSFLGVNKDERVQSWIKKMTPDNLPDVIINYDELVKSVQGTEFESMV